MLRSLMMVCVLSLASGLAQATLVGRSALTDGGTDYQAYYDTTTNLTWVADANLAQTSGYHGNGKMIWAEAQIWAGTLNTASYLGATNWRLPTVTDTGTPGCNQADTGTDCGFNVDLATGEMARMFYTLGNQGGHDTSGGATYCNYYNNAPSYCLIYRGPFSNLQSYPYWSGTEYAPGRTSAWYFDFMSGYQGPNGKSTDALYAWAVRSGDIAAVPVPPAVWLFGSALGLLGVVRRKISS